MIIFWKEQKNKSDVILYVNIKFLNVLTLKSYLDDDIVVMRRLFSFYISSTISSLCN